MWMICKSLCLLGLLFTNNLCFMIKPYSWSCHIFRSKKTSSSLFRNRILEHLWLHQCTWIILSHMGIITKSEHDTLLLWLLWWLWLCLFLGIQVQMILSHSFMYALALYMVYFAVGKHTESGVYSFFEGKLSWHTLLTSNNNCTVHVIL